MLKIFITTFIHLYQPKLMINWMKLIKSFLQPLHGNQNPDMWWCINGNRKYSLIAVYNSLKVGAEAHIIFKWLWQGANRVRHTIFFWMLLYDRINTMNMLKRRSMQLESYECVMCTDHAEETIMHLLWDCNFAEECWDIVLPQTERGVSPYDEILLGCQ